MAKCRNCLNKSLVHHNKRENYLNKSPIYHDKTWELPQQIPDPSWQLLTMISLKPRFLAIR
ncbi:hypothetical protein Lal_00033234 [Lupinus albus]|nr:hypothetical protein Lal_00033234 [Lupinus albus]